MTSIDNKIKSRTRSEENRRVFREERSLPTPAYASAEIQLLWYLRYDNI